ncbi:helix-turn-helix domain-containing protein [Amycolatopsis thermoflava]|uniref:helix-turn-helix domain-containing protein n=1 Tax=Amycolatopsis thermoflava TaxID=84480 RepID=UPI0036524F5F
MADLDKLDDQDYPAFTTGQAAKLLGVQEAFLRNLDAAGLVRPERSEGGHRRYSRRQLTQVARLREQLDQGHTLAAAGRIIGLQDQLADTEQRLAVAETQIEDLRAQLHRHDGNRSTANTAASAEDSPPPG